MSQPQGHSSTGRIMSMKNSNDTIGNRTRGLLTCSAVPQPTAPLRAPFSVGKELFLDWIKSVRAWSQFLSMSSLRMCPTVLPLSLRLDDILITQDQAFAFTQLSPYNVQSPWRVKVKVTPLHVYAGTDRQWCYCTNTFTTSAPERSGISVPGGGRFKPGICTVPTVQKAG